MSDIASPELPIYVVTGANWECEVPLDEEDSKLGLSLFDNMIEAATKAVEIVKGVAVSDPDDFRILDNDSAPYLGIVVHVHVKGTNPDKGELIPSYIPLANGGFYKESVHAHEILLEQEMEIAAKAPRAKVVKTPKINKKRNKKGSKAIQKRKKS